MVSPFGGTDVLYRCERKRNEGVLSNEECATSGTVATGQKEESFLEKHHYMKERPYLWRVPSTTALTGIM